MILIYPLGEDALLENCLKGLDNLVGHGMVARQPRHNSRKILKKRKKKKKKEEKRRKKEEKRRKKEEKRKNEYFDPNRIMDT
jgi:hypothetical protein